MIILVVAAGIAVCAPAAAIVLEPHVESWATRKRLSEAHRDSGGTSNTSNPKPEPHATSPNVGAETEPHQPRVGAGKSAVTREKL